MRHIKTSVDLVVAYTCRFIFKATYDTLEDANKATLK